MHSEGSSDFPLPALTADEMRFAKACGYDGLSRQAHLAVAVRKAIAAIARLPAQDITAEREFANDLIRHGQWDSLDNVEFVLGLEDHLPFKISDEMAERFTALRDVERPKPGYQVRHLVRQIVEQLLADGIR